MKSRPQGRTVAEYLAAVPAKQRAALRRLRKYILAAAPGAEDCISYRMPAVRYRGKVLVWYGASASHCAFYPGGLVKEFAAELAKFSTSKGTVRFQPEAPLPAALIRKLVKARIARTAPAKKTARVSSRTGS